jgi:uncharacterized protein (TIGR03083 family)
MDDSRATVVTPALQGPANLERAVALSAIDAVYQRVSAAVGRLTEADMMRPSRCAGWAVADVLYHQLLDARRALRTFATPSPGPPDRDHVSYWREFSLQDGDESAPGDSGAAAHARYVRSAASAYPPGTLAWEWGETAAAARRAARACGHPMVATQGHVLRLADFVGTLAVEAAVHYLDLTVGLPQAPDPDPASLRLVRQVLDGLLGTPLPARWGDVECALKGTGREPLSEADRHLLGPLAGAFPLFG